MAFPRSLTTVANLASTLTSPADSRADLQQWVENLNSIIDEQGQPLGVVTLSAAAVIAAANVIFPRHVNTLGTLTFAATERTTFANIMRLQPREETSITQRTDPEVGDIQFCANLQSVYPGTPGIIIYTQANVTAPWSVWSITSNGVEIN